MVDFNQIDPNDKEGKKQLSFHVDNRMQRFLDKKVKQRINFKDKDYVMLVDGTEGSGKSVFSMQIGKYVDPTLCLERVCMTPEEFKEQVMKTSKGQCVIYDEAVTGMTATDSISKVGKLLKSLMMQMRQNNLFVIVIIPYIFDLNRYSVLGRARSFFHIYENGDKQGYWVGFNKKDTRNVYLKGKKTYAYRVKSKFFGRFYGKYIVNELEYRTKKREALEKVDVQEEKKRDDYKIRFIHIIKYLKAQKKTWDELELMMDGCSSPLKKTQLWEIGREIDGK